MLKNKNAQESTSISEIVVHGIQEKKDVTQKPKRNRNPIGGDKKL